MQKDKNRNTKLSIITLVIIQVELFNLYVLLIWNL